MPKKTLLTRKMIAQIAKLVKKRLNWVQISQTLNIGESTLHLWRKQGKEDIAAGKKRNNLYMTLVQEISKAKNELIEKAVEAVEEQVVFGGEEIIEREVLDKEGNIRTLTTTKRTGPDAALALKLLERIHPGGYATVHRVQVDWRDLTRQQGADPDKVASGFQEKLGTTLETATPEELEKHKV